MNFADVKNDIKKMIGIELDSIRPGAKITIVNIDEDKGSILLKTSSGELRSRPIDELKRIWGEMMITPAVHVDGVLRGSGTSRNQPETILANLPYVEWLKLNNKKHIAFVGKNTHAYGTLKQMDAIRAAEISSKVKNMRDEQQITAIIVAKDINKSVKILQSLCTGTLTTVDIGFYQLQSQSNIIIFLSADIWKLEEGLYCVIKTDNKINSDKIITLYGVDYSVFCNSTIKAFVQEI